MSKLQELGIPSSFELFSHTVSVIEIGDIPELGKYADWDADKNEIRVFTAGLCDDVIEHSFYHELCHALVERAGQPDLSKDEVFIDVLGGLLMQYTRSAEEFSLPDDTDSSQD